jgi:ribosomal protein S27E
MNDERPRIICGPRDLVGDSEPVKCASCGADLFLSPSTKLDCPNGVILCPTCGLAEMEATGGQAVIGIESRKELARHGILVSNDPATS